MKSVLCATACLTVALSLTGCSIEQYPTSSHPSCSWESTPPAGAGHLCDVTYRYLDAIALAEVRGHYADIRRLVPQARIARRIIAFGRTIRSERVSDFHVVPSFTLTGLKGGDIAAGFYLVGRKGSGDISRPQTVYLRVRGSKAVLIQDLPGQEW